MPQVGQKRGRISGAGGKVTGIHKIFWFSLRTQTGLVQMLNVTLRTKKDKKSLSFWRSEAVDVLSLQGTSSGLRYFFCFDWTPHGRSDFYYSTATAPHSKKTRVLVW